MTNKKLMATSIILLCTTVVLSPFALAQSIEETTSTENSSQLDTVSNNNESVECITSINYDALTEEQKVNQELPLCYEYEVLTETAEDVTNDETTEITTEELAAETLMQNELSEQSLNDSQCITPLDYDALTNDERAAIEIPLCD